MITGELAVLNGEVSCPKKLGARIARDACVAEQARCGVGCRIACVRGPAAIREKAQHELEERKQEEVREVVRERYAVHYQRWGRAAYLASGRRRRKESSPRTPNPAQRGR